MSKGVNSAKHLLRASDADEISQMFDSIDFVDSKRANQQDVSEESKQAINSILVDWFNKKPSSLEQDSVDIKVPGATWETTEQKNSSGLGLTPTGKIIAKWTRQSDGTSIKEEPDYIYNNGEMERIILVSRYQPDDTTSLERQKVRYFYSKRMITTDKFDEEGRIISREYNLRDYQNNCSDDDQPIAEIITCDIENYGVTHDIKDIITTSREIKDENDNTILSFYGDEYYDKDNKPIDHDLAYKIIEENVKNHDLKYFLYFQ